MTYTGQQLAALLKMGISMAAADGRIADEEKVALVMELANFGVSSDQAQGLLASAQAMDAGHAFSVLSTMSSEQKKYATGYLAVIMASDGEIADSEVKMWQLICTLSSFPIMNFRDAMSFWNEH